MIDANGMKLCDKCLQKEDIEGRIVAILAFYKSDHESAYWKIREEIIGHRQPLTGGFSGEVY